MEKQHKFIFALGILLVLLPLSGLPSQWNIYIASFVGLILILIVIFYRVGLSSENSKNQKVITDTEMYVDSNKHFSDREHSEYSEDTQEVEVNLKPGQSLEIDMEDDK